MKSLIGLLVLVTVTGCGKSATPVVSLEPNVKPPAVETPAAVIFPETLKSVGYDYSGLSGTSTRSYKLSGGQEGELGVSNELTSVEGKVAKYKVTNTGMLPGVHVFEVREDGVYLTSFLGNDLEKPALQLPSKIEVGSTWSSEMNVPASSLKMNTKYKAVRTESITVAGGKFDALVVEVSGEAVTQGQKQPMSMTVWYVRGIGEVKEVSKIGLPGKSQEVKMEMTK